MEKLPPPFVQSLRFSSPVNQDILHFEDFSPYFQVDPEEDYSEHSLLKSATKQRTAVQTILSAASPTTTDPQILPVLNAYLDTLLNVFGLLHEQTLTSTSSSFSMSSLSASLNNSTSTSTDPSTNTNTSTALRNTPKRPGVAWTSTLSSTANSTQSWSGDLSLEVIAVLANKAVALVRMATTGPERLTKPMCALLREAAGIYDWIGSAQLNARAGMPEASPHIVHALSAACRGTSQQIGVSVGFTKMASKHRLLAQLCIGNARLFTSALATLRSASTKVNVDKKLRISLACWPFVWRTLAFEQMALLDQSLSVAPTNATGKTTGKTTATSTNNGQSRYILLMQLASTELDQVAPLLLQCGVELIQCIVSEQQRIRAIVDQARGEQQYHVHPFDTASAALISQNVLPEPKFLSSAKALLFQPPSFEGKQLTGLGAFSLETLKAVALVAVQMDRQESHTKAYKYYEITISMMCLMLWHKAAWVASMGPKEVTDGVQQSWRERIGMYRDRQAVMLSFITKESTTLSNTTSPSTSTATTTTSSTTSTTPTTTTTLPSTPTLAKAQHHTNASNKMNVPEHLNSFIQVPESRDDDEDGFSELRLSPDNPNSMHNEYPQIAPRSRPTHDHRPSAEWQLDEIATPPSNTTGTKEKNTATTATAAATAPLSATFSTHTNIGQPTVVTVGASSLTIEWETMVNTITATAVNKEEDGEKRTAPTNTEAPVLSSSTGISSTGGGSSNSTGGSSNSSSNSNNKSSTGHKDTPGKELPKRRKRSFTEPALVVEHQEKRNRRRRQIPVFQVGWKIGASWHTEPTLVVGSDLSTKGQCTKENLAAGVYQFRVRLHQPIGKEALPWSEASEPYAFGIVVDEARLDDGPRDGTKETNEGHTSGSGDGSRGNPSDQALSGVATLRAPSVDDDGNLLEIIDPMEIAWDDPLVILGQGGFGIVSRSAVGGFRGMTVAVKRVKPRAHNGGLRNASESERAAIRDELLSAMLAELYAESAILAKLSHQSIVSVVAINLNKESPFLVMEYCDAGTLKDLLHPMRSRKATSKKSTTPNVACALNVKQRLILAEQVISAVAYLHAKLVVHRDLKPANVLLTTAMSSGPTSSSSSSSSSSASASSPHPTFIAKLTDFGLSRTRSRTGAGLDTVLGGSYPFLAPEAFRSTPITQSVDVYSFGIMLHEIVSLEKPWHGFEPFQITVAVAVEGKRPRIPTTKRIPKSIWSLVKSCWMQEAHDRPEALEVCITLRSILNALEVQ